MVINMPKIEEKMKGLWTDTVDAKPEDYHWREREEFTEWEIPFEQTDEELESEAFEPMMDYRYLLPNFEDKLDKMSMKEAKNAVDRAGNMTLVKDMVDEKYYLALTGGGMDLSWDIAKGHINLGYLPPAHFCRHMPRMAGMTDTKENMEVIEACRRSLDAQKWWDDVGLKELDMVEEHLHEEGKKRRK